MQTSSLDVSPVARFLIELAERRANGYLELGGRRLSLAEGQLVGVAPAAGDESLGDFLLNAGRVDADGLAKARAVAETKRVPLEVSLTDSGAIQAPGLHAARRSLWLDRLIRALRTCTDTAPALEAGIPGRGDVAPVEFVPLLLDALARLAGEVGDAEAVGAQLDRRILWHEHATSERARRWAGFAPEGGSERPAISSVLAQFPAAAPRIAALVRAGFVSLVKSDEPSLPPRKSAVTLPPPAPRLSLPPASSPPPSVPPELSIPPRPPMVSLEPGSATEGAVAVEASPIRDFSALRTDWQDPLRELEQRIETLEAGDAAAAERAAAWCELARLWHEQHGSAEEAAKAYREAAAADPSNALALERAAQLCRVNGDLELATAYVDALCTVTLEPAQRARALSLRAALSRGTGDIDAAVEALCEAAAEDPSNAQAHELVAHLVAGRNNQRGAVAHARAAARVWRVSHPERARAVLAWAYSLDATDPALATDYADVLEDTHRIEAAVAVLVECAATLEDADESRGLRLDAAQRAELGQRPDLAAEILCAEFDAEPHVDVFYEPLVEDTVRAGALEDCAVLAEEIAGACPDLDRSRWLVRAGNVQMRAGRKETAMLLYGRAIRADPQRESALDKLRRHAETARDHMLLADALHQAAQAHLPGAPDTARRLLSELAALAEEHLGGVDQALAAWRQIRELSPSDANAAVQVTRLSGKAQVRAGLVEAQETDLARATPEARPEQARRLADLLRAQPGEHGRAIQLYQEYLAARPADRYVAAQLEWLLCLVGDDRLLERFLSARLGHVREETERARLLDHLAQVHSRLGDHREAAECCRALIELHPGHAEAIARLNRAAVALRDATLQREAIALKAQVAPTTRHRARALTQLGAVLESAGELDAAVAAADAALALDDSCADAALLIMRHHYRLPRHRAVQSFERVHLALGDSQPVLAALALAAREQGDAATHTSALERWHLLVPFDPDPALARLEVVLQGDDAGAIRRAAEALLNPAMHGACTSSQLERAVARIDEEGDPESALALGIHALDELGGAEPELIRRLLDISHRSDDRRMRITALERACSAFEGTDRVACLREVAEQHWQAGDPAGELRAALRILGELPNDTPTLERLTELYAACGDASKLIAVLSLLLQADDDHEHRRRCLSDLVAATALVAEEPEEAVKYVRQLVEQHAQKQQHVLASMGLLFAVGDPRWALERNLQIALGCEPALGGPMCEWLVATAERTLNDPQLALQVTLRALERFPQQGGLLLGMERLTLALDAVEAAMTCYDKLIEASIGIHGKRALRYRTGRWLERAGRPADALVHYVAAFDSAPSAGVLFKSVDRLARQTQKLDVLVSSYLTLADKVRDHLARATLLQRAAEVCLDGLDDTAQGFDLLLQAWSLTDDEALYERARDAARRLGPPGAAARQRAVGQIVEALARRAESTWDPAAKIRDLLALAELHCADNHDVESAFEALDEARQAAEAEQLPAEVHADVLCGMSRVHAAAEHADAARQALEAALEAAPKHERALSLQRELGFASAIPAAPSAPMVPAASAGAEHTASSARVAAPEHEAAPDALASDETVRRAAERGDLDAMEVLADSLRVSEAGRGEARSLLSRVVEQEPWRLTALRGLYAIAQIDGTHAECETLAEVVSIFDRSVSPPAPIAFTPGLFSPDEIREAAIAYGGAGPAYVLRVLWEGVRSMPGYRRSLPDLGVDERSRITNSSAGVFTEAYAMAARALGLEGTPMFLTPAADPELFVAATAPPAVIADSALDANAPDLTFRIAYCLSLTRPEHVVLGAYDEPRARTLLSATRAAFGPTGPRQSVPAEQADLAARLWQAVPAQAQRELRDSLQQAEALPEYEDLLQEVRQASSRAGLLATGSVRQALLSIFGNDARLGGIELGHEKGFQAACRKSPSFAAVVRWSLTDSYLHARTRNHHRQP